VQLQGGIHPLLNLKAEHAPSRLPVSYRLARLALQYDKDEKLWSHCLRRSLYVFCGLLKQSSANM